MTSRGELATKAQGIFGSRKAAREWFRKPALALNGRRPADLLKDGRGRQELETLLVQLAYGVYI